MRKFFKEHPFQKIIVLILLLLSFNLAIKNNPYIELSLGGFYQSETPINNYFVQLSINKEDHTFIEYINNREVNRGYYEKSFFNDYKMIGNNKTFKISLNKDNSFEVFIDKINGNKAILLNIMSLTPSEFNTEFKDIEEYKDLIK